MSDATKPVTEGEAQPGRSNGRYDVIVVRIVASTLGLTALFTALDMTILQAMGKQIPEALGNLGSTAVGALALALGHVMAQR